MCHVLGLEESILWKLLYHTQSNLQIWCNPYQVLAWTIPWTDHGVAKSQTWLEWLTLSLFTFYQIANGTFHRNKTKNFIIHMETQRPWIAKAILRKKNEARGINFPESDYTTKLQSSRQYGTGTKTEI